MPIVRSLRLESGLIDCVRIELPKMTDAKRWLVLSMMLLCSHRLPRKLSLG